MPAPDPGAADRRLWVRYPCERWAACYSPALLPHFRWRTRVADISRGGLRLLFAVPPPRGALLWVELPTASGSRAMPARVVWCDRAADSDWSFGCRFMAPLSEDELAAVLADI